MPIIEHFDGLKLVKRIDASKDADEVINFNFNYLIILLYMFHFKVYKQVEEIFNKL